MFSIGSTFDLDLRKHLGSLGFQHQSNEPISAYDVISFINDQPCNWKPRKIDKPIALYGAGSLGKMAKEYFDFLNIPIEFVIDQNFKACQSDPFWQEVLLYSPEDVDAQVKSSILLIVCVVTWPFKPLAKKLLEDGWHDVEAFYDVTEAYRDRHPLSNGWFIGKLSQGQVHKITHTLLSLCDSISKAHYLQFFTWHRLREEWRFEDAPIFLENRFFIPEIVDEITNEEYFVDLGAHHGKVFFEFLRIVNFQLKGACLVEPDPKNFNFLHDSIELLPISLQKKIQLMQAMISNDHSLHQFFNGLGYASQCSELGNLQFLSIKLDDLQLKLDDLGLRKAFVKLHLEGSELKAIKGGEKVLQKYRPILVLTCYHNSDGLWKLQKWLWNHLFDYHIYFRLHSWCGTGAVLYCIPERR